MHDDDRPLEEAYWPQFFAGGGMVVLLHVLALGAVWGVAFAANAAASGTDAADATAAAAWLWTVGLGFGQLGFVIPLTGLLLASGRRAMASGVLAAAGLVFLLNSAIAACLSAVFMGGFALCMGILFYVAQP